MVFSWQKSQKTAGESFAQDGDDPDGHTKEMCDVSDELCDFF
jgi:hypothetical protein